MATVVYIDGENLFHSISDVLISKKLIKHRNDLIKFDMAWFIQQSAETVLEAYKMSQKT